MTDYRPDAGPSMEDNYRSTIARLMGENAALKREIDGPHGYKHQIATLHRCALEKTTAEASRDALAGKLGEVAEIISGYGTPGEKIGRIALITGNATIARSAEK